MEPENLPEPIFIDRAVALERLANALLREPWLAVDTESNSLYAYQEQVCLIQFSTPKQDFLVDPLALANLSPLRPVFASERVEKIFHAAEYDLICLKRDFGFEFANLFDTMLAARILGIEAIGLGSLLESEFGVQVDKRYQRANWGQRPLPPHLLAYAQLDTHYLIRLRERLAEALKRRGLWPLAVEDFQRARFANGRSPEHKPAECWRVAGAYDLPPQKAAVLAEVCQYRDHVARSLNRPLFKVLNDKTLLAIAEECPTDVEELRNIAGMSRDNLTRHARGLLAAVERGLKAEPVFPSRAPRPNERFLERLEALRSWRKEAARKMGVGSDVVLPRDLLHALAETNPRSGKELEAVLAEVPWRLENFGEEILKTLRYG